MALVPPPVVNIRIATTTIDREKVRKIIFKESNHTKKKDHIKERDHIKQRGHIKERYLDGKSHLFHPYSHSKSSSNHVWKENLVGN